MPPHFNEPPYTEPDDEPWHGTKGGYVNHKCRGPRCTAAATKAQREARAYNRKHQKLGPGDPRHGTQYGYSHFGCKCGPCKKAHNIENNEFRKRRRARLAEHRG